MDYKTIPKERLKYLSICNTKVFYKNEVNIDSEIVRKTILFTQNLW